jgi:hypothetical protein
MQQFLKKRIVDKSKMLRSAAIVQQGYFLKGMKHQFCSLAADVEGR